MLYHDFSLFNKSGIPFAVDFAGVLAVVRDAGKEGEYECSSRVDLGGLRSQIGMNRRRLREAILSMRMRLELFSGETTKVR